MKLIIGIIILATNLSMFAQDFHKKGEQKFFNKYEQLEKIKLLEILNLDEETAIKFFARRNEHKNSQVNLLDAKKNLLDKIEMFLETNKPGNEFREIVEEINKIEIKLTKQKVNFIESIRDLLNDEQVAKLILFDYKFKKDIRDLLIEKGKNRFPKDKKNN